MIARLTGSGSDGQTVTILPKSGSFSSNSGKPDGKTGRVDSVTCLSGDACGFTAPVLKTGVPSRVPGVRIHPSPLKIPLANSRKWYFYWRYIISSGTTYCPNTLMGHVKSLFWVM